MEYGQPDKKNLKPLVTTLLILLFLLILGTTFLNRKTIGQLFPVLSNNALIKQTALIGSLGQSVSNTTSSSVTIQWQPLIGATGYKIYIASEPNLLNSVRKLVGSTTATTFTINNLAPEVDVFLRVEAEGANIFSDLYAKTIGGPVYGTLGKRKALDNNIQEVHLVAPNIVEVIVRDERVDSPFGAYDPTFSQIKNYNGITLQNGTWTVKRNNGNSIAVSKVYRHSIPAGNNYYNTGFVSTGNDNLLDVEHRIYLVLNENIGNNEIMEIKGPLNISFTLPFSDKYLVSPTIKVNQVGYNPRATERYAYLSNWLGNGSGLPLSNFPSTAKIILDDPNKLNSRATIKDNISITLRASMDADAGSEVKQIDLSGIPESNNQTYRVYIPGVGVSWPTTVSEYAVLKAYYITSRGLFYNRFGRDLDCKYTNWCSRQPDHPQIFTSESNQVTNGQFFDSKTPTCSDKTQNCKDLAINFSGGHHDAGDFDIGLTHEIVARQLMRAYEVNPNALNIEQSDIPESSNRIPDILDEALWSLKGWENLQGSDGGVRHGVESWRHPWGAAYYADQEPFETELKSKGLTPLYYWTESKDPIHTLRIAGLFAQASRLVKSFDLIKSDKLKEEAIKAYDYSVAHGMNESIAGPMLYASGELYTLTGNQKYKTMFESTWLAKDKFGKQIPTPIFDKEYWATAYSATTDQPILPDHVLGYFESSNANQIYEDKLRTLLTTKADSAVSSLENSHGYRNGRASGGPVGWGQGIRVGEYVYAVFTRMQMGGLDKQKEQEYFNSLSLSVDYVLGANPYGYSWVVGLGSRFPQNPLHLDSKTFVKEKGLPPMYGIVVYGPAEGIPQNSWYDHGENVFYPEFKTYPTYFKYGDISTFVNMNEFTVHETESPVTSLIAMTLGPNLQVPDCWKPGKFASLYTLPTLCDTQTTIQTPPQTTIAQCSDGIDNDNDGKIDLSDPDCSSPTDNDESSSTQNSGGGSSSGGGGGSSGSSGGSGGSSGGGGSQTYSTNTTSQNTNGASSSQTYLNNINTSSISFPTNGFSRNLSIGSTAQEVLALQKYLNLLGFKVATSGFGSPGNETTFFGNRTRDALAKFQRSRNIYPPFGYFGPITRGVINKTLHP